MGQCAVLSGTYTVTQMLLEVQHMHLETKCIIRVRKSVLVAFFLAGRGEM